MSALDEAAQFRSDHVGVEHLLLALTKADSPNATTIYPELENDCANIRETVVNGMTLGSGTGSRSVLQTPAARQMLIQAMGMADSLGHPFVNSEHLFKSLIDLESEPVVAQLKMTSNLDLEQLRHKLTAASQRDQETEWSRRVGGKSLPKPQALYDDVIQKLSEATSDEQRAVCLGYAIHLCRGIGKTEVARTHAEEVLALLPNVTDRSQCGEAVFHANIIMGQAAMREGRLDDAKRFLLEGGKSAGSPTLDTFGPNMSLAKELLEKGEQQVVLEYFDLCRSFWEMHRGRLDQWSREVSEGRIPEFGANLVY